MDKFLGTTFVKSDINWDKRHHDEKSCSSAVIGDVANFNWGKRVGRNCEQVEEVGVCEERAKAIHFWAPTFKWGISIANVADFSKPPEKLSYPQQIAVACTGIVWSRYSTVITPKNWNLFSVNVAMAGTGLYQLYRKVQHDYSSEPEAVIAKE
ncbi:hypothetical protein G4B88_010643 [Cannabis sativa]|uniref:Mitochondrial pyruvate carrier n=1 Tax=Cannabis sativa TaxID=3483 RepID=A0A7J6GAU7_CANSA|nr:hypothetical protein G4B88_010643 [Cannabis sativa]